MTRKAVMFFILVSFVICLGGCNTVKGAANGAAKGAKEDFEDAKKADARMRKNLW